MDIRRVVTGHDRDGNAVFVSDERVAPLGPGLLSVDYFQLWGGDEAPKFPNDGSMPPAEAFFPPVGGFRFGVFTVPPSGGGFETESMGEALTEVDELMPGLAERMEPEASGMHTTATNDFEVVLSGEVVLELDDGATVQLRAGDTVVQNGTRHRWSNPGSVPATLAVFVVGAHHDCVP